MAEASLFRASDLHASYASVQGERKKKPDCIFCEPPALEVYQEAALFRVLHNIYAYYMWDQRKVEDHLMLVPKRHVDALGHLNEEEQKEWFALMTAYESRGYTSFTRPPQSAIKTVPHLHTHLIKVGNEVLESLQFSLDEGSTMTFSRAD